MSHFATRLSQIGTLRAAPQNEMGSRRNRDNDWIELVVQLAGLLILLSLVSPQVRQIIRAVGYIGICVFGAAMVGLVGFVVYRLSTRSTQFAPRRQNDFAAGEQLRTSQTRRL